MRVLDEARTWLFPLYASPLTPAWLRALGAKIGKDVEASTVLMIPRLTTVNDGAFLADDTLIGGYELGGGWLRVERAKIGKRAFVGNSGMAAPGPQGAEAVAWSPCCRRPRAARRPKAGTSWLGSPPDAAAPARRADATSSRTYDPPTRLKVARALRRAVPAGAGRCSRCCSASGSASCSCGSSRRAGRRWLALLVAGSVLVAAGAVAAGVTAVAKWLLVGPASGPGTHPLWSSFVWRNELADTFVEVVAAPWFARAATGTPVLNVWLRALGAQVGRGVWCETYWLPEADLVELGDGATVNHGCVVQTHLFHDRVLSMDVVDAASRRHARAQQRDPARGDARAARDRRPGVAGDARRDRAGPDPLDRQPDRTLGRRRLDRSARS